MEEMTVSWSQLHNKLKSYGKLNGPKEAVLRQVKLSEVVKSPTGLTVRLAVESGLSASMLERLLLAEIRTAFLELTGMPTQVEIEVSSRQAAFPLDAIAPDLVDSSESADLALDLALDSSLSFAQAQNETSTEGFAAVRFRDRLSLDSDLNFESMVETAENRFGLVSMRDFAENSSLGFSVVTVHGPSGVGKSHLLHATGLSARRLQPSLRVKIVTGDEFITDFQSAITKKNMGDFRRRYRLETDFLLVDDLHSISRAKATQEEFFNLMNHISATGRRLAITCDRPIQSLDGLEERIQSRLVGGLVVPMRHPEESSRRLILARKLASRGVEIDEVILSEIARRHGPCVRSLEGVVNTLAMLRRTGSLNQEIITQVLGTRQFVSAKLSPTDIMSDVASHHRLTVDDLRGRSRTRVHIVARRESMRRLQKELGLSVTEIGRLHLRNHATVLNALRA